MSVDDVDLLQGVAWSADCALRPKERTWLDYPAEWLKIETRDLP